MKEISKYIIEKFKLNSKNIHKEEISNELKDILDHFEFDNLYEIDKGRLQKEPYITKEEGKDIISKLNDFLIETNANKDNFKYFCVRGMKFKDNKIDKDYKKNNSDISSFNMKINFADDKKRIFKKGSLYFEISKDEKLIGMYGPFGGSKICYLGK